MIIISENSELKAACPKTTSGIPETGHSTFKVTGAARLHRAASVLTAMLGANGYSQCLVGVLEVCDVKHYRTAHREAAVGALDCVCIQQHGQIGSILT